MSAVAALLVRRTLAAAALVALAAPLYLPALLDDGDDGQLSAFRDDDADVSAWRTNVEDAGVAVRSVLSGPGRLAEEPDPARTLWAVLGPERPYSETEQSALSSFLARGGALFLADAGGYGNQILPGLPIRFGASHVLDERYRGNLSFVEGEVNVPPASMRVLFNRPVALVPGDNFTGQVLSETSNESYLDVNANGRVDVQDVPGPFPVVAWWTTSREARILLSADLGTLRNGDGPGEGYDHAAFHRAIRELLLPRGGLILVDETVHAQPAQVDTFIQINQAVGRATGSSWLPWGLAAAGGVALIVPGLSAPQAAWRRHQPTYPQRPLDGADDLLSALARRLALTRLDPDDRGRPLLAPIPAARIQAVLTEPLLRRAFDEPQGLSPEERRQALRELLEQIGGNPP